jgi:hypothetical protein
MEIMRSIFWGVLSFVVMAGAAAAYASPCRDNSWQPTYVHDLITPDGDPFYVMPNGSFAAVAPPYVDNGPLYCARYGVRDGRGFTNCRDYTRVQCGCDDNSWGNSTCASFLTMRGHTRGGGPGTPPPPGTGLANVVKTIQQPEKRDGSGRITVEGATIHVIRCNLGPSTGKEFYVYQYTSRGGFKAIQPPDWGHALGGREFGTFAEAVTAACSTGPAAVGSGSQTFTVTNEKPEKYHTSFATVAGATYIVEASGVFSDWPDHQDGIDPVWCYAQWRCGNNGEAWQQLRIDGKGMAEQAGHDIPYNPSHHYAIEMKGTGQPIELYLADAQGSADDNHGKIQVTVRAK